MMRQSFSILFNHEARTVYFPYGEEFFGKFPWEFAHPDCREVVKESFQKCLRTKKPQFHVVKLSDEDEVFKDNCCCCWLTPVDLQSPCNMPCVAILAKCVMVPDQLHLLTAREREVLSKLAAGITPNEVAREMGIVRSTVDSFLQRVKKKIQVDDTLEVAVWATTYRDLLDLDPKVCSVDTHK